MKYDVLRIIREAEKPVSGQLLAERLSVSRTAVWKQVRRLRELGYDVKGSPNVGYTLKSAPDIILLEELIASLPAAFAGSVRCFDELKSTNDTAKTLAASGKLKPVGLVTAEEQAGGRGRFGRRWISPRLGIWMSIVVRPDLAVAAAGRAAILAAVVTARSVADSTGLEVKIKWPNDILVGGKKVCGILTEMAAELGQVEYLVIGIGLNANFPLSKLPKEVAGEATTLLAQSGKPVDRAGLICAIAAGIYGSTEMLGNDFALLLKEYRSISATLGARVLLESTGTEISGRAVDLDSEGALVVETDAGERRTFKAGEVTFQRD